jgi:toxin ParE1/3/4
MSVIWSKQAKSDLRSIRTYIERDSIESAKKVVVTIIVNAEAQLGVFPAIGRAARVKGTYKLVIPHTPYIVIYRLKEQQVEIARVHHTSRLWTNQF